MPQRFQNTCKLGRYRLTTQDFWHYSAGIMDAELKGLEERLGQLIELCQRLRAENNKLRQDLAASVNANKRLTDKVELAASRLEGVLARLPGSD